MTEKIYWDNLPTTIRVWVETTETLPEGVYACQRCKGTGTIQVGHADPGPNPAVKCGMCNGTQRIKKCKVCKENPVAVNERFRVCSSCSKKYMDHLSELEKRPEVICEFHNGAKECSTPELQEQNSNGHLVCDLESCQYAHRMYSKIASECSIRDKKGDDFCIRECLIREDCLMNKAGED